MKWRNSSCEPNFQPTGRTVLSVTKRRVSESSLASGKFVLCLTCSWSPHSWPPLFFVPPWLPSFRVMPTLLRHAPQCGVTGSQIGCEAERQTRNMRSVICFGLIRFLISKGFWVSCSCVGVLIGLLVSFLQSFSVALAVINWLDCSSTLFHVHVAPA